ncbi:MAG: hypothetical protein RLZZ165_1070 [Bacteroidota bacterium]|jgi:hypothetical protein
MTPQKMPTKIPNFQHCMQLMRDRNPNRQEEGFHQLLPCAGRFVHELMEEFRSETDYGLKCWLLELIGQARSPHAFDLLVEQLSVGNLSYRDWAIIGLQKLNTKEAQKILAERGFSDFRK